MPDKKTCIRCGVEQPISEFRTAPETHDGHVNQCRLCLNELQRARRNKLGNDWFHAYAKTKDGFLMNLYHNMKGRVTGIQKQKVHLYFGKELLPREMFYKWALASPEFHSLFTVWEESGYKRILCPTVDRIDSDKGYVLSNMEWVTHSENSRRGSVSPKRKLVYS
jgi:hypothetical protein